MYVLQIVVCSFVLFLLAIVLSVLPRYTDSDYPLGIFKLFLIDKTVIAISKGHAHLLTSENSEDAIRKETDSLLSTQRRNRLTRYSSLLICNLTWIRISSNQKSRYWCILHFTMLCCWD